MSDDDRSTMITTAEAWLDARRSYAAAGHVLYCHENTVRYRMRRLEEHLDGELDDPTTIAELEVALQAIRTFPELGARIPAGDAGV
jgi:DNA-binding PucR family transcriptional regulator